MAPVKRIQILLSTYNGEKYLREQLDSYLAMDCFTECDVLVRDDGSTDNTPSILNEYSNQHGFEVILGENIGVNASYQWLIKHSNPKYDYFAFSDQDDFWLPNKIALALSFLNQEPKDQILLFASRSCVTNEQLEKIGYSLLPRKGISYYNAMVQNVLPGHTQVFNRKLRDTLALYGCLEAHVIDWWLYLIASSMGKVLYSEKCTVLHRQHGNNAVGYQLSPLAGLIKKIRLIHEGKGNAISCQLVAFLEVYGLQIPVDYRKETEAFLQGLGSFYKRLKYMSNCRVFRQKKSENFAFRLLYLYGKYVIE